MQNFHQTAFSPHNFQGFISPFQTFTTTQKTFFIQIPSRKTIKLIPSVEISPSRQNKSEEKVADYTFFSRSQVKLHSFFASANSEENNIQEKFLRDFTLRNLILAETFLFYVISRLCHQIKRSFAKHFMLLCESCVMQIDFLQRPIS